MTRLDLLNRYVNRYGSFKIRNLLIVTFIIAVGILTVIIILLSSNFFNEVMSNSLIESAQDNLIKSMEMLDIKLQNIYQISYGITNNVRVKEIITGQDPGKSTGTGVQNELRSIIINYCRASDYIYSVNIFKKDYNKASSLFKFDRLEDTIGFGLSDYKLYRDYTANSGNKLYSYKTGMYFNEYENTYLGIPTICSFQSIYDLKGREEIGSLNINVRCEYMFRHISDIRDKYNSKIYIMDRDGKTIFSSKAAANHIDVDISLFSNDILRSKSGWMKKVYQGDDYIIVFNTLGTIGWMVVDIIPYAEIMKDFDIVKNRIILLSLMVTFIIIILYMLIASNMVHPFHMMARGFKKIQKGDLSVAVGRSLLYEVDELGENFNKMVETINRLLVEIETANKKERDAELKALQAQINPHFLYNTLDIIHWMTDNEEISNIINNLGKFFRLSLSGGRNVIFIHEELERVKVYLNIQSIRFKNKFVYYDEVDSSVYNYQMLKLILQPLVENALLHGLKYMRTGGVIRLSGGVSDGNLEFYVEDNGTGVDIERIRSVLDGQEVRSGYGIKNVNERIKLKYGDKYGIYYTNLEEGGTSVKVVIPLDAGTGGNTNGDTFQ